MDLVLPLFAGCLGLALMATGAWGIIKRRRAFGWLIVTGLGFWGLVAVALKYNASLYRTDSEGTYRISSK